MYELYNVYFIILLLMRFEYHCEYALTNLTNTLTDYNTLNVTNNKENC